MPRRVQDIIPAEKRGIRDIPNSEIVSPKSSPKARKIIEKDDPEVTIEKIRKVKSPKEESLVVEDENVEKTIENNLDTLPLRRMPVTPPMIEEKRKKWFLKWPIIMITIILLIVVAGYFASTYYSQATFTIIPKVVPVSVNGTYVAQGTSDNNGLIYEVITLKESATSTVPATSGPVTSTKATGKVTFYNSYSAQSIRLIAGTRLSGDNKLLYRLSSSIVVPGYTKTAGNIVPGKITTNIIADQPGQNYNFNLIDADDLKVVAYAGSPKYDSVYAKPITAVAGGFSGAKKNIDSAVMASTTANLKSKLTDLLLQKSKLQIPNGYISYDKNYSLVFGNTVIGGSESNTATVSLEGTIYVVALPKTRLIEAFAGTQTVSLFSPFTYTAPGLESLNVSITNIKDFSPTKKGALVLNAKGDFKIVGTIPIDEIKKKLAGSTLSSTQDVFKAYSPVIESGSGELAPPWANIPTDLSKVKVIVEEP